MNPMLQDIRSVPGIKRDGSAFNSPNYIDGQWIRFYDGLPRKIGGYKLLDAGTPYIIRNMFSVPKSNDPSFDLYLGRADTLSYINFDLDPLGIGGTEIDRTPVGFAANDFNNWSFDLMTITDPDTKTSEAKLIAQACPNLSDINNAEEGLVYYGNVLDSTPLVSAGISCSGGVIVVGDRLFAYGNNGVVNISDPNDPTTWNEYIAIGGSGTKILQAKRTRGGGFPAVLLWSLDSLTRAIEDTEGEYNFETVSDDITVLSPNSVVKYKDLYFWIGIDNFYFFNGTSNPIPNNMCTDYFYYNVNYAERSKIWGVILPLYQEIWWFWPFGDATECTHVTIYNMQEKTWYDSRCARSSGVQPNVFDYPIMSDANVEIDKSMPPPPGETPGRVYGIWMHEYGFDKVIYNEVLAIEAYFETNIKTMFENNPQANVQLRSIRIEPDFSNLAGDMYLIVRSRGFAQGPVYESGPYVFNSSTPKIDLDTQGRLVSYKFVSNTSGGYFELGKTLLGYGPGNPRPLS